MFARKTPSHLCEYERSGRGRSGEKPRIVLRRASSCSRKPLTGMEGQSQRNISRPRSSRDRPVSSRTRVHLKPRERRSRDRSHSTAPQRYSSDRKLPGEKEEEEERERASCRDASCKSLVLERVKLRPRVPEAENIDQKKEGIGNEQFDCQQRRWNELGGNISGTEPSELPSQEMSRTLGPRGHSRGPEEIECFDWRRGTGEETASKASIHPILQAEPVWECPKPRTSSGVSDPLQYYGFSDIWGGNESPGCWGSTFEKPRANLLWGEPFLGQQIRSASPRHSDTDQRGRSADCSIRGTPRGEASLFMERQGERPGARAVGEQRREILEGRKGPKREGERKDFSGGIKAYSSSDGPAQPVNERLDRENQESSRAPVFSGAPMADNVNVHKRHKDSHDHTGPFTPATSDLIGTSDVQSAPSQPLTQVNEEGWLFGSLHNVSSFLKGWLEQPESTAGHPRVREGNRVEAFPLPWPRSPCNQLRPLDDWLTQVVIGVNWLAGFGLCFPKKKELTRLQESLMNELQSNLFLVEEFRNHSFDSESLRDFWSGRTVNAYGEQLHSAQTLTWATVQPSLPPPGLAGVLRAEELCTGGVQEFLKFPDFFLRADAVWHKTPAVRVGDHEWGAFAQGLIDRGICVPFPLKLVHCIDQQPVMGGMFGVPKGEQVQLPSGESAEILRLIMDLRPVNACFSPLVGDLKTLPMLSQLQPLQIFPDEDLILSSEDIKSMFYVVGVNERWHKFLCFGKLLPPGVAPETKEPYVLAARVLPMGFVNSVAVAQELHREIIKKAAAMANVPTSHELRKDAPVPQTNRAFRIYLDNFDLLKRDSPERSALLEGSLDPMAWALRELYNDYKVPLNSKKSVQNQRRGEMQGAIVDGHRGVIFPKLDKFGRYLRATCYLLHHGRTDLKRIQIALGGLVYIFSYRRNLMSIFSECWRFCTSFGGDMKIWKSIPPSVKEELFVAVALSPLSFLNLRLPFDSVVTASDASETGGGLCQTVGLTQFGVEASQKVLRGEKNENETDSSVLLVSLLDGIGAARVALDVVGANVGGYISVEANPDCRRVVEAHFPSVQHYEHVEDLTPEVFQEWATKYTRASVVLVCGGGPSWVSLHTHMKRVTTEIKKIFTWAQVHTLMECLGSVDAADRSAMTCSFGNLPYKIDAAGLSLCKRNRFYWFDWVVQVEQGVTTQIPPDAEPTSFGKVFFDVEIREEWFLPPKWSMAGGPQHRLPTFTASAPKANPGSTPAQCEACSPADREKWAHDRRRFPLYQYQHINGLIHPRHGWRMPGVLDRESCLGFPLDYTLKIFKKQERKAKPLEHEDARLSALGHSWSVPVLAVLFKNLLAPLGVCQDISVGDLVERLRPGSGNSVVPLNMFLARPPWPPGRACLVTSNQSTFVQRLCSLVSSKGSDVLLHAGTEPVLPTDRLRNTMPVRMWRWEPICGWQWREPKAHASSEHINRLEMRAALTAIKWRIQRQGLRGRRFLHLLDSLVSLQILNKGRTSSRKLESIVRRISAWILCSGNHVFLGYVDTKLNPADRPSRVHRKRKWRRDVS